jgi:hypothetical protein
MEWPTYDLGLKERSILMSRKEVVLLVSRALAVIQFVSAVLEITYLPERLLSFVHYVGFTGGSAMPGDYAATHYRVEIGFLFARIIFELVLTVVFWNCGPWVERTLLPSNPEQKPSV